MAQPACVRHNSTRLRPSQAIDRLKSPKPIPAAAQPSLMTSATSAAPWISPAIGRSSAGSARRTPRREHEPGDPVLYLDSLCPREHHDGPAGHGRGPEIMRYLDRGIIQVLRFHWWQLFFHRQPAQTVSERFVGAAFDLLRASCHRVGDNVDSQAPQFPIGHNKSGL